MQITGMLYGSKLLHHVDSPATEVHGSGASEDDIQRPLDRHKLIFIKPVFKGRVGKKGKLGLIGKATDLKTALAEKERLYFAEHRHGNATPRPAASRSRTGSRPSMSLFCHNRFDRLPRANHDADP
jgi:hypothetical protein